MMQGFKIGILCFAEASVYDLLCAVSASSVLQMCTFPAALLCGKDGCMLYQLHEKTPFGCFLKKDFL